ncbi:MAG: ABC transporter permease [Anaerolineae bacterium]|jgi:oligopeptide transport system permease protein|nr:ABC transporter permease [Anaerolineae bacterium]MBT7069889.1 ABC transporter permease [Anaerolineae bacterium]MBT7325065.1 ABC transporter permease [Anaerolineae bacterium]
MTADKKLEKLKNAKKIGESRSPMQDAMREFRRSKIAVGGMIVVVFVAILAIFAPVFSPYGFEVQNLRNNRAKPMEGYDITETYAEEKCHWYETPLEWGCTVFIAGSDALGRDLFSRIVYGTRVSLAVALAAASVSLMIGLIYGTVSGYAGGNVDNLMMRLVDFLYAIPLLPIIILMTVYFNAVSRQGSESPLMIWLIGLDKAAGGLLFVFIAIGALNWLGMARLARGQVLSYKEKEFVEAARALGAENGHIIFKHLIPNVLGPLLIAESMAIPGYIFLEAVLSFIGLGVTPPTPSWGAMINEGYSGLRSNPHLVLFPGFALSTLTLAFNFMGDGLRDAFDTRLRGRN